MYNLVAYLDDDVVFESDINKVEAIIGKSVDADVVLKGWNISKVHAKLIVNDEDVFIEDSASMFGTYVNNQRIVRHGPITHTDVIRVGGYVLSIITIKNADRDGYGGTFGSGKSTASSVPERAVAPVMPVRAVAEEPTVQQRTPAAAAPATITTGLAPSTVMQVATPLEAATDKSAGDKTGNRMPQRVRQRSEEDLLFIKWLSIVHAAVLNEMDKRRIDVNRMNDADLRSNVRLIIREVIRSSPDLPKSIDVNDLSMQVLDEAVGLGPLEPLLADDEVSEIMINKFDEIWVEKRGQLTLSNASFTSDSAVLGAIERIVTPLGRRIDESSPMVDARLKDGSRVNAIIPPLAIRGPSVTIRKFSKKQIGASDFVAFGSLTEDMVELIKKIVELRLNVIVSGGTGTGKTTFLNMVGNFVADDERIVTIEDAAELKLTQPNLISLESRPPNLEGKGVITIRDLVRNSLRMRPDRIIVGECRGGEALDMLQAMNTGHDGSMTTLHSNSPRDAMARLEVLVLMAGMNLPVRAIREQIASAVNVVVQLTRFSCGARKVTSISEIVGMEGDVIQMQEVYRFRKTGRDPSGRTVGMFEYSGLKPDFLKRLEL
jgi:pilus assembly protein CpaF